MKCLYLILLLFSLTLIGCKSNKNLNTHTKEDLVENINKIDSTRVIIEEEKKSEYISEKSKENIEEQNESIHKNGADSIIIIEDNGKVITKIYKPSNTSIIRNNKKKDFSRELESDIISNKKLTDSIKNLKEQSNIKKKIDNKSTLKETSETKDIFGFKTQIILIVIVICLLEIFSKGTLTKLLVKIISYMKKGWQYVKNVHYL